MTPDDIRKLVTGYATGTLTEAEQRLLFEAALDDQDLFDELAREQELKELLDQPGAKQRLIAALGEPQAVAWWRRPWAWAAAGIAVTTLVLVFLTGPNPEPEKSREIAQATAPAAPAASDMQPGGGASAPQQSVTLDKTPAKDHENPAAGPTVSVPAAKAAASEPAQAAARAAQAAEPSTVSPDAPPPPAAVSAISGSAAQPLVQPAPESAANAPASNSVKAESSAAPVGNAFSARRDAAIPSPQRAVRAEAPALGQLDQKAKTLPRFAFDYAIRNRRLEITPAADGYLQVSSTAPVGASPIFPADGSGLVRSGSTVGVEIPAGASELDVVFAARPPGVAESAVDRLKPEPSIAQTPQKKDSADVRDSPSGTAADPSPSPDSRIRIRIAVRP